MPIALTFITIPKRVKTASRSAAIWRVWLNSSFWKTKLKKPLKYWIWRWKKCHWIILGITVWLLQSLLYTTRLEVPKKEVNWQ